MRAERLQVSVEVDVPVHGIDEPVQADLGAVVRAVGHDPDLVLRRQPLQSHTVVLERARRHPTAVHLYPVDPRRGQVHERGGPGLAATEGDERLRAKGVLLCQIERDSVSEGVDEGGSGARLDSDEVVLRRQGCAPLAGGQ